MATESDPMKDWKGNLLDLSDEVYLTEDGLVKKEDLSEYYGFVMPSLMKVFEYEEMLKEEGSDSIV